MFNLCIFIFIISAVSGSAELIIFGKRRKQSRIEMDISAYKRRNARRRLIDYKKRKRQQLAQAESLHNAKRRATSPCVFYSRFGDKSLQNLSL